MSEATHPNNKKYGLTKFGGESGKFIATYGHQISDGTDTYIFLPLLKKFGDSNMFFTMIKSFDDLPENIKVLYREYMADMKREGEEMEARIEAQLKNKSNK